MGLAGINSGISESDLSSDIYATFAHQFPYYAYNNPIPRIATRKSRSYRRDVDTPAAVSTVTPEAEKMTGTAPVTPTTPATPAPTTTSVVPEVTSTAIAQAFTPSYTTVNGKKVRDTATNKLNFIKTFLPVYRKVLKEKGISEDFAESLVAQAALESAWGYSPIGKHATVTNNYIGVKVPYKLKGKGKGQTVKTHEEVNGKLIAIDDEFMKFDSLEDMARHHIDLLSRKRYQAFSGGVGEFASRVKNGGYATASQYVPALNKMIDSVRNAKVQFNKRGGHLRPTAYFQYGGNIVPNFIQRLEDPNRKFIINWENPRQIATHKMSAEYYPDDSGRAIAYPEVQEINGQLIDFTRPPYHSWAGYDSAIQNKDYLMFDNLQDAIHWTQNYKKNYKNFK